MIKARAFYITIFCYENFRRKKLCAYKNIHVDISVLKTIQHYLMILQNFLGTTLVCLIVDAKEHLAKTILITITIIILIVLAKSAVNKTRNLDITFAFKEALNLMALVK